MHLLNFGSKSYPRNRPTFFQHVVSNKKYCINIFFDIISCWCFVLKFITSILLVYK